LSTADYILDIPAITEHPATIVRTTTGQPLRPTTEMAVSCPRRAAKSVYDSTSGPFHPNFQPVTELPKKRATSRKVA